MNARNGDEVWGDPRELPPWSVLVSAAGGSLAAALSRAYEAAAPDVASEHMAVLLQGLLEDGRRRGVFVGQERATEAPDPLFPWAPPERVMGLPVLELVLGEAAGVQLVGPPRAWEAMLEAAVGALQAEGLRRGVRLERVIGDVAVGAGGEA